MIKPILITGASDGVGLAIARILAAQGRNTVLVGRRPIADVPEIPELADLAELAERPHGPRYLRADLSRPDAAETIDRRLTEAGVGGLSAILHNAAIGWTGAPAAQSSTSVRDLLAVNWEAPIALTHRLGPRLQSDGERPRLAFISSIAASLPCPDYAVYGAAKAALEGFARALRLEWSDRVDVRTIVLGAVKTGMHAKSGMDPQAIGWDRFPAPEAVAADVLKALDRKRSSGTFTIGWTNRWVRRIARRSGRWIDREMRRRRNRGSRAPIPNGQRRCVITGAADGIGRALAIRFAQDGAEVIGIDRDPDRSSSTLNDLRAIADAQKAPAPRFLQADLASPSDRERCVEELADGPPIAVWIHNAGVNRYGRFETVPMATHQHVCDVNLTAPLTMTADLLNRGLIAHGGTLAFVSSLSHYVGYPGSAVYAATKDGIASYARSLGVALAPANIHVATIFPGPTRTEQARRNSPDNRREHRRMPPRTLAEHAFQAIAARRSIVVPGVGHRLTAALGVWAPGLADRAMTALFLR